MGTVITAASNTLNPATRRWLDRAPNGRLWACIVSGSTLQFWYSDDNGAAWAQATGNLTDNNAGTPAMFVDLDGGINIAYAGVGITRYRRGTVSGSTITWSAALDLSGLDVSNSVGDLVAFRNPNGSGWIAMIAGRSGVGDAPHKVVRVNITVANVLSPHQELVVSVGEAQSGTTFNGSIDFHHTGDGKTVQGGTPHIYVAYRSSFNKIWLTKLVWGGAVHTNSGWTNLVDTTEIPIVVFDGTRIMIGVSESASKVHLYERDAGHTVTADHGATASLDASHFTSRPTISYDRDGNVHAFARDASDDDMYRAEWDRQTEAWGAWTLVVASSATTDHSALRVGYHSGAVFPVIEGLYLDGTNVLYQSVRVVNDPPNAPTVVTPADGSTQDVAASLGIIWTFNDPDQGDAQTAYTVRRRIGTGAHTYWNGTSWAASESGATKIASAVTSLAVASGWGADGDVDHHYSVKTWDALDQLSPWSAEHRVIPSAKDNPTITVPASDGTTITTANFQVTWTVATQTKYRLRVIADTGGNPDPAIVDYDSGIRISTSVRTDQVQFPVNGQDRNIELTTWNDEGLASTIIYRQVTVSYTPPAVALLTLSADSPVEGAIVVTVNNTGSGAAEDYNELYRRIVGESGDGIRIAASVDVDGAITDYAVASDVNYEYRAKTFATTGAVSFSAWTD